MRTFILIPLIILSNLAWGQSARISSEQYIITYKNLAIYEMYRTGVPASITIAQGILESQNGNSRLATEGNNHFGIKCKTGWDGKTIIADDDAVGECFRAYETAAESFRDHSNFLRENWRYAECFKLERTDYKAWAEGLRKAGYATNPKYHTLIIGLIERFNLQELDQAPMPEGVKPEYPMENNGVPVVYANEGESIEVIAEKNDVNSKKIYRYNDLPKGKTVEAGDILYLKPKRRKGSEPFHIVKDGENLHDVSQMYGIKLKHLYKKNKLNEGEEVETGTKLYLQKKRDEKPAIKKEEPQNKTEPKKENNENSTTNTSNVDKPVKTEEPVTPENKEVHVIKSGDNLYRISEKYHVFVEDILEWNGIGSPDDLKPGDKIYLTKEAALKAGRNKTKPVTKKAETKPVTKKPEPKTPKTKIHIVVKGDTAIKICKQYGIETEDLVAWNNLKNAGSIQLGQKLKVSK